LSLSSISLLWVLTLSVSVSLLSMFSLLSLLLGISLLYVSVYLLPLKYSVCVWERRHRPPWFAFPIAPVFQQFGWLGIPNRWELMSSRWVATFTSDVPCIWKVIA
jgi:hypothetical protein